MNYFQICILLHYYIKGSPLVKFYARESQIDLLYLPIARVVTEARQSIASYVSAPRPVLLDCIKSECGNIHNTILHPMCITAQNKYPEDGQISSPYVSMCGTKSTHGGVMNAIKCKFPISMLSTIHIRSAHFNSIVIKFVIKA